MIQNIIFDFDGVLVDSEIIVSRAFRQYLGERNIIITEQEFANFAGNKTIDVIGELSTLFNIHDKQKFYNDIMTLAGNIYNRDLTIVNGVEKFIREIKQQKFIASNSGKERIIQGLKNVDLYKFFKNENIFSFDMVKKPKPDPDVYLKVIDDSNINPEKTIIIEDSLVGVQAGRAANIIVIGLTAGGHWFKERSSQELLDAGAYTVAKNYHDLLKIIQGL